MTPVIPSSLNNLSLIPQTSFITRKKNCLTRSKLLETSLKQSLASQRFLLPLSTSLKLFPPYQYRSKFHILSAIGTDIAVEETNTPIVKEDDSSSNPVEKTEESTIKAQSITSAVKNKRARPAWKSEFPPIKNEELIVGATFNGKVKSIQPFGAFIDFGAFTDGLVHVSQLSDSFVKDVGSIVSVGQEVKVRVVEANIETGRISLTMRENDDSSKTQQQKDDLPSGDKSRPRRTNTSNPNQKRDSNKKATKFVKGQDLEGTVKNLARSGAFISLPEGEEGFLPTSEESNEGFETLMGGSSLQIGQEVSVRVLRIARGQVTLTMKKEEANAELDAQLNQGVVHVATNPFLLAFRKNKDISAFLDERETKKAAKNPIIENSEEISEVQKIKEDLVEDSEITDTLKPEEIVSSESQIIDGDSDSLEMVKEEEVDVQIPSGETVTSSTSVVDEDIESIPEENGGIAGLTEETNVQSPEESTSEESQVSAEVVDTQADNIVIKDEMQIQTPVVENDPSETPVAVNEIVKPVSEENGSVDSIPSLTETATKESQISAEVVDTQADNIVIKDEVQIQTPVVENDLSATPVAANEIAKPVSEENGSVDIIPSPTETATKATISPALVKHLRDETGAGMMDCKNALSETGGDLIKAQEYLRKKGLASADKKASRDTSQGRVASYIHDSRIGILLEVNCETDFVSRGDIFKELVDDLAMQAAAYPQVQYVNTEDVPEEIVNKEREIEMQKEDLLSKPEQIRSKIVDGRIKKRVEELALLEQPYIKNDKVAVKDWVKQTIATIGENIKVKRFVRYNLGEGLEKKSQDFAAEVAAQTASKAVLSDAPVKDVVPDVPVEVEETVDKQPTAAVSASLVKKLREETGAGMMDCKKALSETEGDLEKAQEYLRKKGLSTADKKASRLAAEGRIGSYIHDSRIGVLIEVNCETDFVGRSEKFKELVDDLAMQIVASPQVQFVSIEDVPKSTIAKEKELEMQREDLLSKPENMRERIVEGRIGKRLNELALLEQTFIKDDGVLVKDLVKQTVAALGENIKVRRFVRFTLGETIENEETESKV